jgi:hypothetical protein
MCTVVYLRAGKGEYALLGPHSTEFLDYYGRMCVTVAAVIRVPPYGETLEIDGYRLRAVGVTAPSGKVAGALVQGADTDNGSCLGTVALNGC